jgi:hypothetical protein
MTTTVPMTAANTTATTVPPSLTGFRATSPCCHRRLGERATPPASAETDKLTRCPMATRSRDS